jgi:hypothetical protein
MFGKLGAFSTHQYAPFPDVWSTFRVNNKDEYNFDAKTIRSNPSLKMREEWLKMGRQYRDSLPDNQDWWKITRVIATEQDRVNLEALVTDKMKEVKRHLIASEKKIQDVIFDFNRRGEVLEAIPIRNRTTQQRNELDFIDMMKEKFSDYLAATGDPIDYTAAPEFSSILRMARLAKNEKDYQEIEDLLKQLDPPDFELDLENAMEED